MSDERAGALPPDSIARLNAAVDAMTAQGGVSHAAAVVCRNGVFKVIVYAAEGYDREYVSRLLRLAADHLDREMEDGAR